MDTPQPDGSPRPESDVPRESARTILFQFVVFPLGVVGIGVAIFLLFGLMASEQHSVRDYLGEIRSGSSHQRWQAAYQLSKSLKRGEGKNDPALAQEVASLYAGSKDDDPKVRRYLSMVLGQLGDRSATPLLLDGLSDPDVETRIYALLALGQLRDPAAVPRIIPFASNEESDLRKSAVWALGEIGDQRAKEALLERLSDPVADVRWNAALALARFGDRRASPRLREMLDRHRLDAIPNMKEAQKEAAMIAAIASYASLVGSEAGPELRALAKGDPSLRVRAAAEEVLRGAGGR